MIRWISLALTSALMIAPVAGPALAQDAATIAQWRAGAQRGEAEAQLSLGLAYAKGEVIKRDDGLAALWFDRAAKQGNSEAMNQLAYHYAYGLGVARSDERAIELYRQGAEAGNSRAQYNLAVLYATGRGVARDPAQAMQWYERAAKAGDPQAQYGMARLIETGAVKDRRIEEAAKLYKELAEKSYLPAQVRLATLLIQGRGIGRDEKLAMEWLKRAIDQGNDQAIVTMGDWFASGLIGGKREPAEALRWYGRAAETGHVGAQRNMGTAYFTGTGTPVNPPLAVQWLTRAAKQGDVESMNLLGIFHAGGVGTPRNPGEAYKWLLLAERGGSKRAAELRETMKGQLNAQQQRAAEAEADKFRAKPERANLVVPPSPVPAPPPSQPANAQPDPASPPAAGRVDSMIGDDPAPDRRPPNNPVPSATGAPKPIGR